MTKFFLFGALAAGLSLGATAQSLKYSRPITNLFSGLDSRNSHLDETLMVGPVNSPIAWTNSQKTGDFVWTYDDTSGTGNVFEGVNLSVTYGILPEWPNRYSFPVLAQGDESFTYSGQFQAGGGGGRYGLTVCDPVAEGVEAYDVDGVPIFGYSPDTDAYWSEYTFGSDLNDKSWNHLVRYGNFVYMPEALVVKGIWANGVGRVSDDAVFTAELYYLPLSMQIAEVPDMSVRSTKLTVIPGAGGDGLDLLSFYFEFPEPVTILKKDVNFLFTAISGFRDPANVEYFNPMMSEFDSPTRLGLGWIGSELMWDGTPFPVSWASVSSFNGDRLTAFYIMLDAVYPGLPEGYEPEWNDDDDEGGGSGDSSSVEAIGAEAAPQADAIFTLDGRRVSSMSAPGLYIVGGRKVIVR